MEGLRLDGQLLYPQDLAAAPASVREAWSVYERAWAMSPPVPPEDASVEEYRSFATAHFGTFTDAQVAAVGRLIQLYEETADPAEALVYSVLAGRLLHRASSWMWTVPVPAGPGIDPVASRALETTLRGGAQNLAVYATDAYGKCNRAADAASDERAAWRADCEARTGMLAEIRRAEVQPPSPQATPMPDDCEDHTDPLVPAPGPDIEATAQVLVLVDGLPAGLDREAIRSAVEQLARAERQLRPVPASRRRAAERQIQQGRVTGGRSECAAPLTLPWLLGADAHLVVGRVRVLCGETATASTMASSAAAASAAEGCRVELTWNVAGSSSREALPSDPFPMPLEGVPDTAKVVAALRASERSSAILGMLPAGPRVRVAPIEGGAGYALRAKLAGLHECQAQRGVSRLALSWTVTGTGAVAEVTAEGDDDPVAACVKAKVEALALPCPPRGRPVAMRTTVCLAR